MDSLGQTGLPQGIASCAEVHDAIGMCYQDFTACTEARGCVTVYEACVDAARKTASFEAEARHMALEDCVDKAKSACADDATCLVEACQEDYEACGLLGDPSAPPPPAPPPQTPMTPMNPMNPSNPPSDTPLDCSGLYECEDACRGDRICGQACYDRGTEAAKTQWTDLVSCGNASCSSDPDVLDANSYRACLQAQCGSRYNTCFGGAGQTPPPTNPPSSGSNGLGCSAALDCTLACFSASSQEAFNQCVSGCDSRTTATGSALLMDLSGCADTQCRGAPSGVNNLVRCMQDFCAQPYGQCIADR